MKEKLLTEAEWYETAAATALYEAGYDEGCLVEFFAGAERGRIDGDGIRRGDRAMTYIVVLADGETFTDSEGVCVYEVIGDLETEEIEESLRSGLVFPPGLRIEGRFHGKFYHRYDSAGTTFVPEDVEAD